MTQAHKNARTDGSFVGIRQARKDEFNILIDMCYITKGLSSEAETNRQLTLKILERCETPEAISKCTHRLKRDVITFDEWIHLNLHSDEINAIRSHVERCYKPSAMLKKQKPKSAAAQKAAKVG